MKTFIYTNTTERVYLESTDEFEDFGDDFEYTPTEQQLLDAVVDLVYNQYFDKDLNEDLVKKGLKEFIDDSNNLKDLVDDYEDELWEYFREQAFNE